MRVFNMPLAAVKFLDKCLGKCLSGFVVVGGIGFALTLTVALAVAPSLASAQSPQEI